MYFRNCYPTRRLTCLLTEKHKIEKEAGNDLEFDANHELLWADLVK